MRLLPSRKRTWAINAWLSVNAGLLVVVVIPTITWLLLMFPATEPAAFGFFWINIIFFFLSVIPTSGPKAMLNPIRLLEAALIQCVGVAVQVYLIVNYWSTLTKIDEAARKIRIGSLQWICDFCAEGYEIDHRVAPSLMLFAWLGMLWWNKPQDSPIITRMPRRPPFSVDENTKL